MIETARPQQSADGPVQSAARGGEMESDRGMPCAIDWSKSPRAVLRVRRLRAPDRSSRQGGYPDAGGDSAGRRRRAGAARSCPSHGSKSGHSSTATQGRSQATGRASSTLQERPRPGGASDRGALRGANEEPSSSRRPSARARRRCPCRGTRCETGSKRPKTRRPGSHGQRAQPTAHVLLAPGDAGRSAEGDPGARRARDLTTTMRYMHLSPSERDRAIGLLKRRGAHGTMAAQGGAARASS